MPDVVLTPGSTNKDSVGIVPSNTSYRRRRTDLDVPSKMEVDRLILFRLRDCEYGATAGDLAYYIGVSKEWIRKRLVILVEDGRVLKKDHEVVHMFHHPDSRIGKWILSQNDRDAREV